MSGGLRYPLHWPTGWPRTKRPSPSRFDRDRSMSAATTALQEELDRLGATSPVLSANVVLRLDGRPRSGQGQPDDRGVALYFKLKGKDCVLACDRWDRAECNVYAIAKHIEALRGQQRWGVGTLDQAFTGYRALPETAGQGINRPWWEVLGVGPDATVDEIQAAFRRRAKVCHPDRGGSSTAWQELHAARDQALLRAPAEGRGAPA